MFLMVSLVLASALWANDEKAQQKLTQSMHSHFQAMMKLQPYVADADRFSSSNEETEIKALLNQLVQGSSELPKLVETKDPGLVPIAQTFSEYLSNVNRNYRAGHAEFARTQLRSATSFCIACHTRSQMVKPFHDAENLVLKAPLTPMAQAEFFVATRQFDKALAAYDKIFSQKPDSERDRRDLLAAVRSALSVAVRVKQDPKTAFGLLTKIQANEGVGELLAEDIKQWKKDLSTWTAESKKRDPKTPAAFVAKAQALIKQARASQKFPADHRGDINYMRAVNALHAALENDPKSAQRAEIFEMLGDAYGALREPMLWDINSMYYEACVREAPHTPRGRSCFRRLSNAVYLGYSGSSGVNIPEEELERLAKLRKLAH